MDTMTPIQVEYPERVVAPLARERDRERHFSFQRSLREYMLVLLGIIFLQFLLYGPSLCGRKVLLPLEVLGLPGMYIPRTPEIARLAWGDNYLSDPVFLFEPLRHFAAGEIHQGRLPAWIPYEFCGAPFIEPRFSPFAALQFASTSPITLAWSHLLVLNFFHLGRPQTANQPGQGLDEAVHVGVAVLVGVRVRVGVVELIGVTLGVLVFVDTGWLPIRTVI